MISFGGQLVAFSVEISTPILLVTLIMSPWISQYIQRATFVTFTCFESALLGVVQWFSCPDIQRTILKMNI